MPAGSRCAVSKEREADGEFGSGCRFTKPQTFADCIGNELPLGWEEAYDKHVGAYYINHVNREYTRERARPALVSRGRRYISTCAMEFPSQHLCCLAI